MDAPQTHRKYGAKNLLEDASAGLGKVWTEKKTVEPLSPRSAGSAAEPIPGSKMKAVDVIC